MPFPVVLIPVAISAVRSLIRYRIRVDQILSVKKTSDALPFTLPPLPNVNFEHTSAMAEYFMRVTWAGRRSSGETTRGRKKQDNEG